MDSNSNQPMRLRFERGNVAEDVLTYLSPQRMGFTSERYNSVFSEEEQRKYNEARYNAYIENRSEILENYYLKLKKTPEYLEAVEKWETRAEENFEALPKAWEQYGTAANNYAVNILGLGDPDVLDMGEIPVYAGAGTNRSRGADIIYCGSNLNPEADKDPRYRARSLLHEWLHCAEAKKGLDFNKDFGYASHTSIILFERYFQFTLGSTSMPLARTGNPNQDWLNNWAEDMQQDFTQYLIDKGEKEEDIAEFFEVMFNTHLEHENSPKEMNKKNEKKNESENFFDFRNRWHKTEMEREKAKLAANKVEKES